MQLTYRGQICSTSYNPIETVVTEYIARFRGQNYILRRSVQTFNSQLGLRKYRGVFYGD